MFGARNWIRIGEYMPKKSPKQCRQRYHQNLKPEALPETAVRLPDGLCGVDMRSPRGKNFRKVYTVQLDGTIVDGDYGSLVLHRANGDMYGHIIARSSGTGTAYVNPATQVFKDLEQRLGGAVSLPARDGLPSLRQQDTLSSSIVAEISSPDNPGEGARSHIKRDTSADSGAAVDDCEKQKDLDSDDSPWNKDSDRLIKTEVFQTLHRRMDVMSM
jgi:hypothetical protein